MQGSGGGIKSITISVTKMDTLSGKINKQSVWVLTNTLDESTWKQGQFRIPELELDEYYVRYYLYVKRILNYLLLFSP